MLPAFGFLFFHITFKSFNQIQQNTLRILTEITLTQWANSGENYIFTTLNLPILEHGLPLLNLDLIDYFLKFYNFAFIDNVHVFLYFLPDT